MLLVLGGNPEGEERSRPSIEASRRVPRCIGSLSFGDFSVNLSDGPLRRSPNMVVIGGLYVGIPLMSRFSSLRNDHNLTTNLSTEVRASSRIVLGYVPQT